MGQDLSLVGGLVSSLRIQTSNINGKEKLKGTVLT